MRTMETLPEEGQLKEKQKLKKEIAGLLTSGNTERAKIKVLPVIREDYRVYALEILELHCTLLYEQAGLIASSMSLDSNLAEAVSTLIWAAPRLQTEIPELKEVASMLCNKYGKDYGERCQQDQHGTVTKAVVQGLGAGCPPCFLVEGCLSGIAAELDVSFVPTGPVPDDDVTAADVTAAISSFYDQTPNRRKSMFQDQTYEVSNDEGNEYATSINTNFWGRPELQGNTSGFGDAEVTCVMNTSKVLTCTWSPPQNPNRNYTFSYRLGARNAASCPEYLVVNSTIVGCRLSVSDPYTSLSAKLNNRPVRALPKPQDLVKMDPPRNLSIEMTSNMELVLSWGQMIGTIPAHCVVYRVKYRTAAIDSWTEKVASSPRSILSSFDRCQNYTFHVKSKLDGGCANAFMWSEWSDGATWARNATACDEKPSGKPPSRFMHTGLTVGFTLLLVVIFLAVIGQERIWVILVPQIPNPGKKFEDLINGCNVQDWVGVSKEAVEKMNLNYTETLCVVTEDSMPTGPEGKILIPPPPEN